MAPINWRGDWGGNWSKWLEAEVPQQAISVYTTAAMNCTVEVLGPDSLKLVTLAEVKLHSGYNRIPYDLSFAEDRVKPLQDILNKGKEAADIIRIRKADNGMYYLPKGDYKVVLKGSFGIKETTCRIE
jgi:hypothetical protein